MSSIEYALLLAGIAAAFTVILMTGLNSSVAGTFRDFVDNFGNVLNGTGGGTSSGGGPGPGGPGPTGSPTSTATPSPTATATSTATGTATGTATP